MVELHQRVFPNICLNQIPKMLKPVNFLVSLYADCTSVLETLLKIKWIIIFFFFPEQSMWIRSKAFHYTLLCGEMELPTIREKTQKTYEDKSNDESYGRNGTSMFVVWIQ